MTNWNEDYQNRLALEKAATSLERGEKPEIVARDIRIYLEAIEEAKRRYIQRTPQERVIYEDLAKYFSKHGAD